MICFFKILKRNFLIQCFGSKDVFLSIVMLFCFSIVQGQQKSDSNTTFTTPQLFLDQAIQLRPFIKYLQSDDQEGKLSLKEVLDGKWLSTSTLKGDYPSAGAWFKIDGYATENTNQFVVCLPIVSSSKVFIVQNGKILAEYKGGEFVHGDVKVLKSGRKDFIIPLYSVRTGKFSIVIYAENYKESLIHLNWYSEKYTVWSWENFKEAIKDTVFHSIVLVIMLSNLFLFFFFKKRNYLYYSGYLLAVSVYFIWDAGYISNFLSTGTPKLNYLVKVLQNLAPVFYWLFLAHFYENKGTLGNRVKVFRIITLLNIAVILAEIVCVLFLDTYHVMLSHVANVVSGFSMLITSVMFLCCTWSNNKQSLLISAGVLTVALSYLITLINFYLGAQDFVLVFKAGFLLEVFLFSLGLLLQFRATEQQKVNAQSKLIAELRKNKRFQEEYSKKLEGEVANRTKEIASKNKEILHQRNELLENSSELHELNSELLTQAETIQAANERLYKNERILKKAYQRLKETQKELQEKNEAIQKINKDQEKIIASRNRGLISAKKELDDFLYRTSHNLKGPVARIKGIKDLLAIELSGTESVEEYLARLGKVIEKMEAVFEKLNAISLINKIGKAEDSCNLSEVVSGIVSSLAGKIEQAGAEVIEDTQAISYNASPKIIEIILKYLLENALHFKEQKRPLKIEIHVSEQENNFLKILVKDNGIGIEDKVIRKIFNMFYIGSLESEGDGLGLYIVKKAVDKLGGFINVESKYRQGSTFRILLPKRLNIPQKEVASSHTISPL